MGESFHSQAGAEREHDMKIENLPRALGVSYPQSFWFYG
ncbi:hypothetical protein RV420_410085 [Roseovarius sp. EC-SD190]|nr:hypothetical protein RV420_410085 [Roseovarius sp. EC-SD190]